ncbi:Uncharacterized protein BP5553_00036 [Venustampulla echinocandica]|uniref:non-specific serine/threonine protein kinase n=1 Tax=Venustampulla echinocandica TaxID=2656787 RepID=A0A370TX13_9HELO|nr:Uncharacterized protein BP5553_00036 [Venustampulla echinocandica]RDL40057.1 Uncharacterized protein BP5553_00036 [Venustampulla echinocandica]
MATSGSFFYDTDSITGNVEDVANYKPGGYHPVHLGDVLPKKSGTREPRYRVLQKLGHGSFATVWLARDTHGDYGFVAVKISVSCTTGTNNETNILRWLRANKQDHAGSGHVIRLLDDFAIQGPNGTHECLVTEVVMNISDVKNSSTLQARTKDISFQTMLGLSYLHEQGVAHGDLHSGNIAVSLPQLNDCLEQDIMDNACPEYVPVIARNPMHQTDSLPAYLVSAFNMIYYFAEEDLPIITEDSCVKIMDFGNSFRREDERPPPNTPSYIRAPEVTYCELSKGEVGSDWNHSVDIWHAACTLYELNFGTDMLGRMAGENYLIYNILQLSGLPPPAWQQYWDMEKFCKEQGVLSTIDLEASWTERRARRNNYLAKVSPRSGLEQDTDQLIDLLRMMLKIDPEERPKINGLLCHSWFAELDRGDPKSSPLPLADLADPSADPVAKD